jgi:GMP synthase-like glutamine amidotransferase
MTFGAPVSLLGGPVPEWVNQEEELLRRYVDAGKRIIGVCFGAQLLAKSLGASVSKNDFTEAGWHRVWQGNDLMGDSAECDLPSEMVAFHWHQNTFSIPPGASRIFQSEACENQSFCFGTNVFGFQFHFEVNERTVRAYLAASQLWRKQSPFVQSQDEILKGLDSHLAAQQSCLELFLRRFLQ